MLIFHVKKSDLKDMFLVVTWTKITIEKRKFCVKIDSAGK
jgi:hypothetical protein